MSASLQRTIEHHVDILLSGKEVAFLFWGMDSDDQAEFFNQIGEFDRLPMQLQAVTDDTSLTIKGRRAMERIGEYGWNNQKQDA